ncbi:MAG: hypothetical protein ABIG63_07460 [Chloroflexota bacterium]
MSAPTISEHNTCALSIAGIGVSATCDNPKLAQALQRRYRDFPAGEDIHLSVEIKLTGRERSSAMLDTGATFEDGRLHFTASGYRGLIDETAGIGQLALSSAQPVEEVEYFLRVAYALLSIQAGGIMLHAAGVGRDGKAYLFFGHSGSGKTTVARLSPNDTVLNDDLVLLMPVPPAEGAGWQVFGTPFWNPTQVRPTPASAPLAALYRLVQDKKVYLQAISTSEAIAELISNVPVIPSDPVRSLELLTRLHKILQTTPAHKLHFLPDDSFWDMAEIGD